MVFPPEKPLGGEQKLLISAHSARVAYEALYALKKFPITIMVSLFPLFKQMNSVKTYEQILGTMRTSTYANLGKEQLQTVVAALDGLSDLDTKDLEYVLSFLSKITTLQGPQSLEELLRKLDFTSRS